MAPKAAAAPKGPKYADIVKEAISSLKVSLPTAYQQLQAIQLCTTEALIWSMSLCGGSQVYRWLIWLNNSLSAGEGRFQPACHQEVCGYPLPQPAWAMGEDPQLPDQKVDGLWQACEGKNSPFV